MPLASERTPGIENKVAEIVARELGAEAEFVYFSARRGYVRNTLTAGRCDVLAGVPAGMDSVSTTAPYYRTTFVFVERKGLGIRSLDDARLKKVRIGMHIIGEDLAPPSFVLAKKGIVANVVPFHAYGEYGETDPQARIVDAVANGEIDVAIVWGPVGGYFAKRRRDAELDVIPVPASKAIPGLEFSFDIAMGVRKGNDELRADLNRAIEARRSEIGRIVEEYAVPPAGTAK
jgi:mxaJ protein